MFQFVFLFLFTGLQGNTTRICAKKWTQIKNLGRVKMWSSQVSELTRPTPQRMSMKCHYPLPPGRHLPWHIHLMQFQVLKIKCISYYSRICLGGVNALIFPHKFSVLKHCFRTKAKGDLIASSYRYVQEKCRSIFFIMLPQFILKLS